MSNLMMPAWVEPHFNREKNAELELQMLRHFYESWEYLHAIPNDKDHRKNSEAAAQVLVDAAHSLRALRQQKAGLNG